MNGPLQTPFDTVENAQRYVRLLVEAIADAKGEIEADLGEAAEAGCYLGGPPNCGGLESIFGCLLDGYYTVHYVPPNFPQRYDFKGLTPND